LGTEELELVFKELILGTEELELVLRELILGTEELELVFLELVLSPAHKFIFEAFFATKKRLQRY
jgi:hypothetical protein